MPEASSRATNSNNPRSRTTKRSINNAAAKGSYCIMLLTNNECTLTNIIREETGGVVLHCVKEESESIIKTFKRESDLCLSDPNIWRKFKQ